MKRDLLSITDLTRAEIEHLFSLAAKLKSELRTRKPHDDLLRGRTLAMIFEKPSLRTRVTFEIGMQQLGGHTVYLGSGDIRLGERESAGDIARNLDRWVDIIMARTFDHDTLEELAGRAMVPVINGLSDRLHPCQVLGDCFTLLEKREHLDGLRVAFVGDGNNVANSWLLAATRFAIDLRIACPRGFEPDRDITALAERSGVGRIKVTHDVEEAASGSDVLYTDVWASMGKEREMARRRAAFWPYQLNSRVVASADPEVLVMHCLPAHRGEEITDEVIDGPHSVVLDQAENRLHIQKAVMAWLLGARPASP